MTFLTFCVNFIMTNSCFATKLTVFLLIMLIKVITLSGEEKTIDVEPADKILSIKEKLEEREGIPPVQQRLIHQGKQLQDSRTVESYKLKGGTTLHLVVALRGGEVYQTWLQLRYHNLTLRPEIVSLLLTLRKTYLLGLITNGTSRAQWEKVERLNLEHFFDVILVSGDLPWEKPNRNIFHKACKFLGVPPNQCIMVGDKLETDILGGHEAQLGATVWVPDNFDLNPSAEQVNPRPNYVIGDVTDLPDLLPKERQLRKRKLAVSLPDLDDSNSNASDGS